MKKHFIIALLLLLSSGLSAQDNQNNKAKDQAIRNLLELTGAKKLADQMMTQQLDHAKITAPNVPEEFWTRFRNGMNTDTLMEKLLPLYAKYYTLADIQQMVEFYESPVGQKVIKTMPDIMGESLEIGQQYGASIVTKITNQLKEEGYLDSPNEKSDQETQELPIQQSNIKQRGAIDRELPDEKAPPPKKL